MFCGCFWGPCTSRLQSRPHFGAIHSSQPTSALHFWPHRCVPEAPYNSWSFLPFSFCLRCPVDCPPDPFSFLMLSKLLLWLQNLHEIPSRGLLNFLQAISSCWHSTVLVLLFENLGLYLTPVSGRLLCKPLLNSP